MALIGKGPPGSVFLPVLELGAVAATGAVAGDVVKRAPDGAGAALDAVAEAHHRLLLLLVPLVDARRAEVGAVLALALGGAHVLVGDLDVRLAAVLVVLDCEQLVGELFHQAPNRSQTLHMRRIVLM